MKRIIIMSTFFLCSFFVMAQKNKSKHPNTPEKKATMDKYHDNIDDRMKGPDNQVIYIGANGGRYYLKNGKKIYVEYKGNKKK